MSRADMPDLDLDALQALTEKARRSWRGTVRRSSYVIDPMAGLENQDMRNLFDALPALLAELRQHRERIEAIRKAVDRRGADFDTAGEWVDSNVRRIAVYTKLDGDLERILSSDWEPVPPEEQP